METIQIRCKNNKKTLQIPIGSTLSDIFIASGLQMNHGPISAKVNNKVKGMAHRIYMNRDVEFLDMTSSSAVRAYTRTLFFVLCKSVHDIFPGGEVIIDIPVSNGYYCDLRIGRPVTEADVETIKRRMQQLIAAAIPLQSHNAPTEDVIRLFAERGMTSKVKLLKTKGSLYTIYNEIDGYVDSFYGTLMTNTRDLYLFDLVKYYDGLLLRIPSRHNPSCLGELTRQDKMFEIFKEHHRWQSILGISTVGDFNEVVAAGGSTDIINISEALQEKKIASIADMIAARPGVRVVLIAGPSSSGKTTFCKRLSIQLLASGLRPRLVSLDDYFVNREDTPLDDKGDYDYESLYALNIPLLNDHFNRLLAGERVALPRYNFQTGRSEADGCTMQLGDNEILLVEGIHALNPELTAQIPDDRKFRIYASALTTMLLDTHNYIPTTDNRLLRRIIRDYKYRGCSAQETIRRWPSVRAGENKWIFPYQENADVMFNSAMLFELAVIRTQAEPLLDLVPENADEHSEAYRLSKFIKYITPIRDRQLPPTSLLREFLGGSSFKY